MKCIVGRAEIVKDGKTYREGEEIDLTVDEREKGWPVYTPKEWKAILKERENAEEPVEPEEVPAPAAAPAITETKKED